eukprot:gene25481-31126_t
MAPHIFPFCVFLEDTDAYEMVFNNRYMQYATRALGDLLSAVLGDYCQVETVLYKLEDMKALFLIKMARLGNGNTPEAKPVPLVDMIVELGFNDEFDMLDCNRDLNTQFVMHLYERSRNPIDPTTRATCLASKSNTDCLRVVVRWDKVRFNHYGKVLLGDELEIRTAQ